MHANASPGRDETDSVRRSQVDEVAEPPIGALFVSKDGLLHPTDLVRGPWDHGLQHGGAVCGALGWAVEQALADTSDPEHFQLARLTTEILRPVPVEPLQVRTSVERHGTRSRVIAATLWSGDRCFARAASQWVASPAALNGSQLPHAGVGRPTSDDLEDSSPDTAVPLRPVAIADPGASDLGYPRPGFNCDVFEFRCLRGSTEDPGPATIWANMRVDLIEGIPTTQVQKLATVSDLANAVGWDLSLGGAPMVNPDVTLQLLRYPVDSWVCLESQSRSTAAGIGMVETRLWDGYGQIGRVLSTTMESPMPLAIDLLAEPDGRAQGFSS